MMNWTDAQAQCELHEAYLVEVGTMAENTWILETLISPWNNRECSRWSQCCKTWIGATDVDKEGNFTWNRRIAVDFTNWYTDQPDNYLTKDKNGNIIGQHCALFCRDGFWDDNRCLTEKTFICEKE
ncbi:lectin BRA-3-like [Saccostrea cucullata]|uniref:lectin BRA-3-like n=1 Tax=Saccostrea cuccullata TaxID=36930 RepID=UPI002ED45981